MKPASAALPADLAKVRDLVDAWRATASPRARLPEELWGPVMELLATHTSTTVSRALDLDSERPKLLGPQRQELREVLARMVPA